MGALPDGGAPHAFGPATVTNHQEPTLPITDLSDLQNPIPSRDTPTALTVTFRRDRADRFFVAASTIRLFHDNTIGGWGFAASAMQNPDYFATFDGWWFEQDPERPFAERFCDFVRRYEAGHFLP